MKKMNRGLAAALLVLSAILLCASVSSAIPANPFPVAVLQPDGESITIVGKGDEYCNWHESEDGYSVVKNPATGFWEFAVRSGGELEPSGTVYAKGATPPAAVQKHLMPRHTSFTRIRVLSQQRAAWTPKPLSGTRKVLLIRVSFSDRDFVGTTEATHANQLFGAQDSVQKYFTDQSRGALTVNPALSSQQVVTVRLNTPHPDRNLNAQTLGEMKAHANEVAFVTQAVNAAMQAANFDMASFDTNNDGYIAPDEVSVYLILAGYEEADGSGLSPSVWAHAWGSAPAEGAAHTVTVSGKVLTDWAMNGEMFNATYTEQIGTIVHELGHQICRLTDLYDVNYKNEGLGAFSTMAGGCLGFVMGQVPGSKPVNLDAWSRQYLGWESPQKPAAGASVTLATPSLGNGAGSVKLSGSGSANEYFLAEVRDFSGWDAGLDAYMRIITGVSAPAGFNGGLLIMHIDDAVGSGSLDAGNDINDTSLGGHQGVMAVDPTALSNPGKDSTAYSLWWGGNANMPSTYKNSAGTADFKAPASNLYSGAASNVSILNIGSVANGKIAATVQQNETPVPPTPPTPTSSDNSGGGSSSCDAGLGIMALALAGGWLVARKKKD